MPYYCELVFWFERETNEFLLNLPPFQHKYFARFPTETGSLLGYDGIGSVHCVNAAEDQEYNSQFNQSYGWQTAGGQSKRRAEQFENVSQFMAIFVSFILIYIFQFCTEITAAQNSSSSPPQASASTKHPICRIRTI